MKKSEHTRAQEWRLRLNLTVAQLADLTGYSPKSIYWFERGETPPSRNAKGGNANDRQIKPWVYQRYRLACAGAQAQIKAKVPFDWA